MTAMPEALRLADAIEKAIRPEASLPLADWTRAAAELRRLHAENERLAAEVANRNRRALDGDEAVSALANVHAYYEGLEAQRDALLEALKMIAGETPCFDNLMGDKDIARLAIKAVEGEK